LSTIGWVSLLYMTVIQFCLCYVCWFAALERLPAATASIGTLLVPVIGVLAAAAMLREPLGLREIAALVSTLGGWRWRCARNFGNEKGGAPKCAALQTHDIVLLRRAGVPLAVIAEIRSRRRIVGFVSLHAVRHGIVAGRGRRGDNGVVVVIGIVVIVGVVVIAIGRPDASTDREARPEAAVTMTVMMMTAAALPAAARDGTSTYNASAGNGARSEAAITAGCNGHPARSEAAITAGCNGRTASSEAATAAGCNGHAATSKAATTAGCNGTAATASKATAAADSCAATATAAAGPGTAASILRLDGADARRDQRQHKRDRGRCTQNFQIDHCWLHLRDIGPNPFSGRTFPSPPIDCAQAEPVRPELYAE
jgi:hypothetical protein